MISVLQKIAGLARSQDGRQVPPVAWDCSCLEEVCGSCTMLINGRTRMACSALVDRLLEEDEEIELRPMSKFPVVRDLVVDRRRLFRSLERVKAWVPVDDSYDHGPGPRISPEEQEDAYPLAECISCGCCLEACPQFTKIELRRRDDESADEFAARSQAAFDRGFVGAHAISQARLFNMHETGRELAGERLDTLSGEGGVNVGGDVGGDGEGDNAVGFGRHDGLLRNRDADHLLNEFPNLLQRLPQHAHLLAFGGNARFHHLLNLSLKRGDQQLCSLLRGFISGQPFARN